jgi:hypothetical protein
MIISIVFLLIVSVAAVDAVSPHRPMATGNISQLDATGYELLSDSLGFEKQYNESSDEGTLKPKEVFEASMYPFTDGEFGDYASLLIFAVPFLLAWMRQNSALIPMTFGLVLGTWMLWKLPAEWQIPATAFIILSMMGILYGVYKEKY